MRRFLQLFFIVLLNAGASAQDLWDRKVDETQRVLCKKDSTGTPRVSLFKTPDMNLLVAHQLSKRVDDFQQRLNTDKSISSNDRIKFLRILAGFISDYNLYAAQGSRNKDFSAALIQELNNAFDQLLTAGKTGDSLPAVVAPMSYLGARIVVSNEFARSFTGYNSAFNAMVLKDCAEHPAKIMEILSRHPRMPFTDSMLVIAAYYDQDLFYNQAQNQRSPLYPILRRHPHPLVKTLFTMAGMESGRSLTPFLDAISKGEVTIDSINKIQSSAAAYFRLLTETRIRYFSRVLQGDTPMAYRNFNAKMTEKALEFVKEINEAHTLPDARRFAPLAPLSSKELYYLAVLGIDELYTSSFVRGVFQQMVDKLNKQSTDQLLYSVKFDYFRKFIKVSAGYNKLASFLRLMPDSNALYLMNAFISNVDNSPVLEDIEDAVDVADAYVGIGGNPELKTISALILGKVKEFQQKRQQTADRKGETIYRLFDQIFNGYRDTAVDLSSKLGIPSITKVDYKALAGDSGRTVVKLYFYGDEDRDGQISFGSFMGLFGDKTQWKVEGNTPPLNPWFVSIRSLKGKPITIFANRPLFDHTKQSDPDDTAKLKMSEFIRLKKLQPTFVMHRGHSYHVPTTLRFLEEYDTTARLIVLGSCGGYQNLNRVLEICPNAHIVSSKQTGSYRVNDPMLRVLFSIIGQGRDVVWPDLWPRTKVAVGAGAQELFSEYIPPNKNLGMIFIKAYKTQMEL